MFNRHKIVKISIMSIVISLLSYNTAFASTGISREYCYTTNGLSYDQQINDFLVGDGYDEINYTNDSSASDIRSNMPNSDVFYISTHGMEIHYTDDNTYTYGGAVACFDSSGNKQSTLSADPVDDETNYSLSGVWGDSGSSLSNIKLAYYSACYSAQTSSYYGNLIDRTISLGAQSALGFINSIGIDQSKYFDDRFFYYALDDGYDVTTSAYDAYLDSVSAYGQDNLSGIDSWDVENYSTNPVYIHY